MSGMEKLTAQLIDMDEQGVLESVRARIDAGEDAQAIVDALSEGMNIVGERQWAKEFFLADLVMAAEIFKQSMEILEPELEAAGRRSRNPSRSWRRDARPVWRSRPRAAGKVPAVDAGFRSRQTPSRCRRNGRGKPSPTQSWMRA